jgi:hypothetical protein
MPLSHVKRRQKQESVTVVFQKFGVNIRIFHDGRPVESPSRIEPAIVLFCVLIYVDGVEVANDAEPLSGLNDRVKVAKDAVPLPSLENSSGGLYFGARKYLEAGTFFSGLIDDVRTYNRAMKP